MITAHPLCWPEGWPRTADADRTPGHFGKRDHVSGNYYAKRDLTVADAVKRVFDAARGFTRVGQGWRINPDDIIISTNIPTRGDGLPRSDGKKPADPGVAVYWMEYKGGAHVQRAMAIDRYRTVADNLAAIAATLDAMRAIERHGGAQILDRAFTGFTALPSPAAAPTWREVIGVSAAERDLAAVRAAYRRRAQSAHPDRPGGSHEEMAQLTAAMRQAEQELQ